MPHVSPPDPAGWSTNPEHFLTILLITFCSPRVDTGKMVVSDSGKTKQGLGPGGGSSPGRERSQAGSRAAGSEAASSAAADQPSS